MGEAIFLTRWRSRRTATARSRAGLVVRRRRVDRPPRDGDPARALLPAGTRAAAEMPTVLS